MKKCSRCELEKPLTEFYRNKARKDGFAHYCKLCASNAKRNSCMSEEAKNNEKLRKAAWQRGPGREKTLKNKRVWSSKNKKYYKYWHLLSKYNITEEHWMQLSVDGCTICGSTSDLCVDHCHETNTIRGCLCRRCNSGLGFFKDDPALLRRAYEYLKTFK